MELTDLPNEIIDLIISWVSGNSDLAKLTLVSHRFKALAEPILYRHIHLDAEPLEEGRLGPLPTLKRTDQLIANLKAHPERGRLTTSFSLRVTHPLWYQSYPQISIIRRMPELRSVSYDPPAVHGGSLPDECENLTDLRLDFSHVTNHYDEDSSSWLEYGVPLQIISKNLWHPTLRKLQAEKVFFTDGFDYGHWLVERRMRCGRSPVVELRFLDCFPRIEYKVLAAFITSVRRLKRFVFEVKGPKQSILKPDAPPLRVDVRPALQAHHTTIEDLALCTSAYALDLVHFSGSLIQWTALKRLAVTFSQAFVQHAMLHEVLPPQLEELQLEKKAWTSFANEICIDHDIFPAKDLVQLSELAKKKRTCVPGLKRLVWWLQYPGGRSLDGGNYRLQISNIEMFAMPSFGDVGVRFEVVTTPFFKETPFGKRLYEW